MTVGAYFLQIESDPWTWMKFHGEILVESLPYEGLVFGCHVLELLLGPVSTFGPLRVWSWNMLRNRSVSQFWHGSKA